MKRNDRFLSNSRYEILEESNGDCFIKDNVKNKYYFKQKFFASNRMDFENILILNWNMKDTIYLFLIILSIIFAVVIVIYLDDILKLKMSIYMVFQSLVFLCINLILHEIGHSITLKYFGKKRGSYKFKFHFIFPTISVDTSECYLLPKFEKICVFYSGIMVNLLFCGMILICFKEYGYLLLSVIPVIFFNLFPFGGVKTDGYHILVTTLLNRQNYIYKESQIQKILKYVFYIFSIIILFEYLNNLIF